jgi:hypothetical protein
MSDVRQALKEFWQGKTMRARVWIVALVFSYYTAVWWFWSDRAAESFAATMAFLFAALWIKDGARSPDRAGGREGPARADRAP